MTRQNKMEAGQGVVEYALILVLIIVVIVVVLAIFGPAVGTIVRGEQNTLPTPTDVCPGHKVNTMTQGHAMSVDYINQYGDTVYLVYKTSALFAPELQSKQVVPGEDCPQ